MWYSNLLSACRKGTMSEDDFIEEAKVMVAKSVLVMEVMTDVSR